MRRALPALLALSAAGCAAPEEVRPALTVRLEVERPRPDDFVLRVEIANEGAEAVPFAPVERWTYRLPRWAGGGSSGAEARAIVEQLEGEVIPVKSGTSWGDGPPRPCRFVDLRPGERRSYEWRWDRKLLPGTYEARIEYIALAGPPIASNRVRFSIPRP